MAGDSRVRAWSDSALNWLADRFGSAMNLIHASSEPAVAQRVDGVVERYFSRVTDETFLAGLEEAIKRHTEEGFADGVSHEDLESNYAADKEMQRSVALSGHEKLPEIWQRVVLACGCQTLPNRTVGPALTQLGMKRFEAGEVLNQVRQEESYSVSLEPAESNLRISLNMMVSLTWNSKAEEINFHHAFVVRDSGQVVKIEETTVRRVAKIASNVID